jgi:hypothetical protein
MLISSAALGMSSVFSPIRSVIDIFKGVFGLDPTALISAFMGCPPTPPAGNPDMTREECLAAAAARHAACVCNANAQLGGAIVNAIRTLVTSTALCMAAVGPLLLVPGMNLFAFLCLFGFLGTFWYMYDECKDHESRKKDCDRDRKSEERWCYMIVGT